MHDGYSGSYGDFHKTKITIPVDYFISVNMKSIPNSLKLFLFLPSFNNINLMNYHERKVFDVNEIF